MRRILRQYGQKAGSLDYVTAWFIRAGEYLQHSDAQVAFVATNSIAQGEHVAQLWPILFHRLRLEIAFAHRTFAWPGRAGVHCVIIGLVRSGDEPSEKRLYSYIDAKGVPVETTANAITAYLFDSKNADRHLIVTERRTPLVPNVPAMRMGSKVVDGGNYIFDGNKRAAFLLEEPKAASLLVPFVGSMEYIRGGQRWILDLQDVAPKLLRDLPQVKARIGRVRAFREASKKTKTRELAASPLQFEVDTRPKRRFLVVPEVSSERRRYVPIGWVEVPAIPSNKLLVIEEGTIWHFGILTSSMHMAWMAHVGGRLESRFQYSGGLVYNTFPWPDCTPAQRKKVEQLAQAVLDARALPKNATSSLADLYDPNTMPAQLRKAHRDLDVAVDNLYRPRAFFSSDLERVEHLFPLYEALVLPTSAASKANKRTARRISRGPERKSK